MTSIKKTAYRDYKRVFIFMMKKFHVLTILEDIGSLQVLTFGFLPLSFGYFKNFELFCTNTRTYLPLLGSWFVSLFCYLKFSAYKNWFAGMLPRLLLPGQESTNFFVSFTKYCSHVLRDNLWQFIKYIPTYEIRRRRKDGSDCTETKGDYFWKIYIRMKELAFLDELQTRCLSLSRWLLYQFLSY